jgi:L-alanine-DL-glutamate epimerase-like enolase superfamily enzyme
VKPQPMAWEMCKTHIAPDKNGEIRVPETPGLGIEPDLAGMKKYLVDAEIRVGGKILYRTPALV